MEKISNKLFNWASIIDDKTREQALRTATMPFIKPHLALMPDAHLGASATVGSVIPTLGAVMPVAVGVDIGCGMIAVRTQFTRDDLADMDAAMAGIEYNRSSAFLHEIPGAYKNIDVVMEDAKELVEVRHILRQVVNVKGY